MSKFATRCTNCGHLTNQNVLCECEQCDEFSLAPNDMLDEQFDWKAELTRMDADNARLRNENKELESRLAAAEVACESYLRLDVPEHEPTCICSSLDGRGKSCCGIDCPIHPPTGRCPTCGTPVHGDMRCYPCEAKQADKDRPKPCRQMQRAYFHIIETFQALEWWLKLDDKNPETSIVEVKEAVAKLRDIWEHKIIHWHIAEDDHHNWHEPE